MSKRILGLAIENRAVTGVVIKSSIKGSAVETHARVPLAGAQDFGPNLSGAIEVLAAKIEIAGTTCCVSLPAGNASFRHIRLPFHDEKKIRQILPYELEPQLPWAVEELVIDYYWTGPSRNGGSALIAAAVKKTTIESLLAVLAPFGIDPVTITAGGFAAALCLTDTIDRQANWVLADVDGVDLSIFFAKAGALQLARATCLPASGETPTVPGVGRILRRSLLAYQDGYHADFNPEVLFTSDPGLFKPEPESEVVTLSNLPVERLALANRIPPPSP